MRECPVSKTPAIDCLENGEKWMREMKNDVIVWTRPCETDFL
jgi:hypothetical protein